MAAVNSPRIKVYRVEAWHSRRAIEVESDIGDVMISRVCRDVVHRETGRCNQVDRTVYAYVEISRRRGQDFTTI